MSAGRGLWRELRPRGRAPGRRLLLLATMAAGCGPLAPRVPPPGAPATPPPAVQAWTPERIGRDPGGYLTFADAEIVRQIAEREQRIAAIDRSRQTLGERAANIQRDLRDAANIRRRLQAAIARADADDAWPTSFAGRKLERPQALAIADSSERFVQSREPLGRAYAQAMEKIDATAQSLRSDISELGRLREKLALDMERVRLNQGIAEVAELRKSVDALSGFATSLADTTDNPLEELAAKARPLAAETELESLLGK